MIETFFSTLGDKPEIIISLVVGIGYLCVEHFLKRTIQKLDIDLRKKYQISSEGKLNINAIENIEQEDNLMYYKYKNLLSFVRFGTLLFFMSFYIIHKLPNFFSVFAIAVSAIIVTFKDIILSFFGFFFITTQYKIGENIILHDGNGLIRGEIISINILHVKMIGKDKGGEHNGQLYKIPNFKLIIETVRKEEISLHKYQKEELKIHYSKEKYELDLNAFIDNLCEYLDELLPKRTIDNVGNYKTFIGHKYKLKFEYLEDKLILSVTFIEKPRNIFYIEKKIYSFIQTMRK